MTEQARVFASAKIIAACTLLSRVTGLARDILVNVTFGQNWIQDAFNYGFQIPNLFRRLFGEGALAAVFVPTFTETLDRDGKSEAWRLLGRLSGLLVIVLVGVTIVLEIVVLLIWWLSPQQAMRGLMLGLTATMLPFMIGICLLALFSSILNCLNHFTMPALAPVVLNLAMIVGVLFVGPMFGEKLEMQVYGLAISVLAGSILQLLVILPVLRGHGVIIRPSLEFKDERIRRMMRSFAPILIGQGVLLLNVYFDAQICTLLTRGPTQPETFNLAGRAIHYPLEEGALSAVTNAARLYQFPLGVLAISLATAAFPAMSRHAARGDHAGLRDALGGSLRMAVFEGLPSGLIMIVLAEPIVSLLFEYGRFGSEQTTRAAWVLTWYGVGMWAFCAQHIVIRGFYSIRDTLTPMWIGAGLVALNQAINLTLLWHPDIREAAFGIGTSVTAILYVGIGLFILRRRLAGRIGGRRMLAAFARTSIAGATAFAATTGAQQWFAPWFSAMELIIVSRAAAVFVPMGSGLLVYLVVARTLKLEEVRWLVGRQVRAV
jgi:putative peptidoglycan lipid II flippase